MFKIPLIEIVAVTVIIAVSLLLALACVLPAAELLNYDADLVLVSTDH